MMFEDIDIKTKTDFRIGARHRVRDLNGNVIAEIETLIGTDKKEMIVILHDKDIEVRVKNG